MIFAQAWISRLTGALATRLGGARRARKGQGLVEYALIIAVVALVALVGLGLLGGKLNSTFSTLVTSLGLPGVGG